MGRIAFVVAGMHSALLLERRRQTLVHGVRIAEHRVAAHRRALARLWTKSGRGQCGQAESAMLRTLSPLHKGTTTDKAHARARIGGCGGGTQQIESGGDRSRWWMVPPTSKTEAIGGRLAHETSECQPLAAPEGGADQRDEMRGRVCYRQGCSISLVPRGHHTKEMTHKVECTIDRVATISLVPGGHRAPRPGHRRGLR